VGKSDDVGIVGNEGDQDLHRKGKSRLHKHVKVNTTMKGEDDSQQLAQSAREEVELDKQFEDDEKVDKANDAEKVRSIDHAGQGSDGEDERDEDVHSEGHSSGQRVQAKKSESSKHKKKKSAEFDATSDGVNETKTESQNDSHKIDKSMRHKHKKVKESAKEDDTRRSKTLEQSTSHMEFTHDPEQDVSEGNVDMEADQPEGSNFFRKFIDQGLRRLHWLQ